MIIEIKRPLYSNGILLGFHEWERLFFDLDQQEAEEVIADARRDNPQCEFRIVEESDPLVYALKKAIKKATSGG